MQRCLCEYVVPPPFLFFAFRSEQRRKLCPGPQTPSFSFLPRHLPREDHPKSRTRDRSVGEEGGSSFCHTLRAGHWHWPPLCSSLLHLDAQRERERRKESEKLSSVKSAPTVDLTRQKKKKSKSTFLCGCCPSFPRLPKPPPPPPPRKEACEKIFSSSIRGRKEEEYQDAHRSVKRPIAASSPLLFA